MECPHCGVDIEPKGNWLISEADIDCRLKCHNCGEIFEVEHVCYPDIELGDGDSMPGCIETIRKLDGAE